jgi:hypothetical protein
MAISRVGRLLPGRRRGLRFGSRRSCRFLMPRMIRRWISIAVLAVLSLGPAWLLARAEAGQGDRTGSTPAGGKDRLAVEFHQDFRGGKIDDETLRLVGGNAEQLVKIEPDGLHIRMPEGVKNPAPVGVVPRFWVHGDFEITVSFEILTADKPVRGYGLAASIWVETDTDTAEAATIERGIIPMEGERFTSTRISGPPPPENRKYDARRMPAMSRSGKLRMAREGSSIITSFADGTQPFRVLRKVALGPEDLTMVRVAAETGVSDHSIEVRFQDLTIRADGLPGYAGAPPEPPRPPAVEVRSEDLTKSAEALPGPAGTPAEPPRFPWALIAAVCFALLGAAAWWRAFVSRGRDQGPPVAPMPAES